MMNIYTFLNEIFFASFEALNILLLFLFITNKKDFLRKEKLRVIIFIILYTIFTYWIAYYIPIGYHTLLIFMFTMVTLSLVTRSNIRNSTAGFTIIIIFMIVTEIPIAYIFSLIKNIRISDIIQIPTFKLYLSIIVKGTQLSIILMLLKFNNPFFKSLSNDAASSNTISYYLFGICLVSVYIINYIIDSEISINIHEVLLFIILLLYILLAFMTMKEKEQLLKIQHKYNLQEAYVKNIETILNIVRREKHDFANHINTIHAMCVLNKPNTVKRIQTYIDKLCSKLHSSYHFYNTGNDYVDGLLAVKSNYAFEHDIHFEVEFEALLDHISMDSYDLISILGNIIDNAFEAVMMQPDLDSKVVSIYTYIEDDQYYLSIANNGPPISQEHLERIFVNGFSTKSDNTDDHGLGLYIVKQLVEKNNGSITVSSCDAETEFLITLDRWNDNYGKISSESYELHSTEQS